MAESSETIMQGPVERLNNGDTVEMVATQVQVVSSDRITWDHMTWPCLHCGQTVDHQGRERNKALCRVCGASYDVRLRVSELSGPRPVTLEDRLRPVLPEDFALSFQISHPDPGVPSSTTINEAVRAETDGEDPFLAQVVFSTDSIKEYLTPAHQFLRAYILFRDRRVPQQDLEWPPPGWELSQPTITAWIRRNDAGITDAWWTKPGA